MGSIRTDDTLDGMKELMIKAIPRAVAEVSRFDEALEDLPTRQSYTSHERHAKILAEVLADQFGIGLDRAKKTLKVTLKEVRDQRYYP